MKKLLLISMACIFAGFSAFAGFTNVISTETPITASIGASWNEHLENLRDNNPNTKFSCEPGGQEMYIQYELSAPAAIYKYTITTANDSPERDPVAWKFLGSTDESDWVELDSRTDEFFPGRLFTTEYVVRNNSNTYKYYRLLVSKTIGNNVLSFADLNLYTEDASYTAPQSLKITGSAVAENAEGITLGWQGGYFELFTNLKSGNYSIDGGSGLTGGVVSTTNDEPTPYRIFIDYRNASPVVSVQKIEKIDIWAPRNTYEISELTYTGNSTFTAGNLTCSDDVWGDERYRVRIYLEGGDLITYGAQSSTSSKLVLTHNEQWGEHNGFKEWNIHVSDTYRNKDKPFDVTIAFTPGETYINTISDYVPDVMPDELSIQGSALVESQGAIAMKKIGSTFELYTSLSNGDYSFVGDAAVSGGSITDSEEPAPYRIRIEYLTTPPTVTLQKVEQVYLWAEDAGGKIIKELTYRGNGIFKAENMTCNAEAWTGMSWEARHLIGIKFEDATEKYGPQVGINIWTGNWGNMFNVTDEYKNTGVAFNAIVSLSVADYSYTTEKYTGTTGAEKETASDVAIYPTVVADNLNIALPEAGFEVEIFSVSGKMVLQKSTDSNTLSINNINTPSGVYIVKVVQNGKAVSIQRIIKQ